MKKQIVLAAFAALTSIASAQTTVLIGNNIANGNISGTGTTTVTNWSSTGGVAMGTTTSGSNLTTPGFGADANSAALNAIQFSSQETYNYFNSTTITVTGATNNEFRLSFDNAVIFSGHPADINLSAVLLDTSGNVAYTFTTITTAGRNASPTTWFQVDASLSNVAAGTYNFGFRSTGPAVAGTQQDDVAIDRVYLAQVPEPSVALLGGLGALALLRRRRA